MTCCPASACTPGLPPGLAHEHRHKFVARPVAEREPRRTIRSFVVVRRQRRRPLEDSISFASLPRRQVDLESNSQSWGLSNSQCAGHSKSQVCCGRWPTQVEATFTTCKRVSHFVRDLRALFTAASMSSCLNSLSTSFGKTFKTLPSLP